MPLEIVADLVAEHGRELRLVLGAEQQAGPDLHHAVRRHTGVEIGRPQDVGADIAATVLGEPADDAADIGVEIGIADQLVRAFDLALLLLHDLPEAALVGGELRRVPTRDPSLGYGRGAAGEREGGAAAETAEQAAAADQAHLGSPA